MQSRGEISDAKRPSDIVADERPRPNLKSRSRLAAQYLPLVRRLCNRYRYSGVAPDDLFQIGSLGLLKAIDKFDPDRGSQFMSFAIPVILGEIKNYFRDHGWAVKVPRKLQRNKVQVERAVESLTHEHGRSPTVPEIAAATEISEEEVYDTFEVVKYGNLLSLEAEYEQNGSGDASRFLDYLGADDPRLERVADKIDLSTTLDCLTDRERTIIRLKFYAGLSQTKIAARLGISQMHVSRLQRNALAKLEVILAG